MALQVIEVCFFICFMFFNILVSAYIIGTITLVVVRGDERTREYRDRMKAVSEYTDQHGIPKMLRDSMQVSPLGGASGMHYIVFHTPHFKLHTHPRKYKSIRWG